MSEKDKAKAEKKAQSRKGDESPKDDDDFSKYDNDPKILAVYDWFTRETESKNRYYYYYHCSLYYYHQHHSHHYN
jgi:hypothetical protein